MEILIGLAIILGTAAWGYIAWLVYHDAENRQRNGWLWFTRVVIAGALLNAVGAAIVGLAWLFVRGRSPSQ